MVKARRRKSAVRKTEECLKSCLDKRLYSLVLNWADQRKGIFSILFKHKKATNWSREYLSLFQEFDRLSPNKCTKYKHERDSDQACKRRFKANLRKLCKDKVLEFIHKECIDKTTKQVYYKFSGQPTNNNTNVSTDWINNALYVHNVTNFSTEEIKPEIFKVNVQDENSYDGGNLALNNVSHFNQDFNIAQQRIFEKDYGKKDSETFITELDNYEGHGFVEEFYSSISGDNFKDNDCNENFNQTCSLFEEDIVLQPSDFTEGNVPPVEESTDIKSLLQMVEGTEENILQMVKGTEENILQMVKSTEENIPYLSEQLFAMNKSLKQMVKGTEENMPFLSNLFPVKKGMDLFQVVDEL